MHLGPLKPCPKDYTPPNSVIDFGERVGGCQWLDDLEAALAKFGRWLFPTKPKPFDIHGHLEYVPERWKQD